MRPHPTHLAPRGLACLPPSLRPVSLPRALAWEVADTEPMGLPAAMEDLVSVPGASTGSAPTLETIVDRLAFAAVGFATALVAVAFLA